MATLREIAENPSLNLRWTGNRELGTGAMAMAQMLSRYARQARLVARIVNRIAVCYDEAAMLREALGRQGNTPQNTHYLSMSGQRHTEAMRLRLRLYRLERCAHHFLKG